MEDAAGEVRGVLGVDLKNAVLHARDPGGVHREDAAAEPRKNFGEVGAPGHFAAHRDAFARSPSRGGSSPR